MVNTSANIQSWEKNRRFDKLELAHTTTGTVSPQLAQPELIETAAETASIHNGGRRKRPSSQPAIHECIIYTM